MKKIGLFILTIVLCLGALGIGYAAWTDTVTITGTVNTGSVDLVVSEYSGMWMYKVPGGTPETILTTDPDFVPPQGGFLVAFAKAAQTMDSQTPPQAVDDGITVTFDNLFPLGSYVDGEWVPDSWDADFIVHYSGSIPVKVQLAELSIAWTEGSGTVTSEIIAQKLAMVTDPDGKPASGDETFTTVGDEIPVGELEGVQMEFSNYYKFIIRITVPQHDTEEANEANMSLSGTITGVIQVIQWNEYVSPIPVNPECAAAACGTFTTCNAGGNCGDAGVCVSIFEGGGTCAYGPTPCSDLTACPGGSSECATGEVCAQNTCCSGNVCVPGPYELCFAAGQGGSIPPAATGTGPSIGQ